MKRLTREWVGKAEDDFHAAHRLRGKSRRFHDQICFHCQQAAEKYLKAVLQERGVLFDRTHDLEKLLIVLLPDPYQTSRSTTRIEIPAALRGRDPRIQAIAPPNESPQRSEGTPDQFAMYSSVPGQRPGLRVEPEISDPLKLLQYQHATARFDATVRPPCFREMMWSISKGTLVALCGRRQYSHRPAARWRT